MSSAGCKGVWLVFTIFILTIITNAELTDEDSNDGLDSKMKRAITRKAYSNRLDQIMRGSMKEEPASEVPCEDLWSAVICRRYSFTICKRMTMNRNCLNTCNLCGQYDLQRLPCEDAWGSMCVRYKHNLCGRNVGKENCKKTCGHCD